MNTKWVLPLNPKQFDVVEYLKEHDTFVWKAKKHFKPGDIVFIYVTKPVQEIRYRCICIEENVDNEELEINAYAKQKDVNRYSSFKVDKEYPAGLLKWNDLHANGMGQALLPTKVYSDLDTFIEEKEKEV